MTDLEYLKTLPYGSDYNPPERIVCAANRYGDVVLAGVRHGCDNMYSVVDLYGIGDFRGKVGVKHEQGFLTNKHRFVDRKTAWKIALEQRQIVRLVGSQSVDSANKETELFSENLY